MELQLEELEASAAEDEAATAPAEGTAVGALPAESRCGRRFRRICRASGWWCRRRAPARAAAASSPNSARTITETLEVVPRQWKVIQTVREKFTCRSCEKITQPPAPFHVIPRAVPGRASWR